MRTIPISDIQIAENRQRQEFEPEAMQELITSIEERGLMHPIVLRTDEVGQTFLVAGERRLRAIQEIFALGGHFICDGAIYSSETGEVPYTFLGDLSPLEYEEAELDENLKRKDLTWQEHAAAVARLHELRDAQKKQLISEQAEATGTAPAPHAAQTVADTARELTGRSDGYFQDSIRKELIVSKHLSNPLVAKAKSADEAFKILRKEESRQRNLELAETVGKVFSAGDHRVLQCNCLDWMADPVNAEQFDVILTDPPYGINAQDFGDGAGRLASIEHHYDDSYESWQKLLKAWADLSFRVAKPQAHAYVFCDIDRFHELRDFMRAAGWYVFRTPFTVVKDGSGRVPLPDRGPRRQSEWLLYAIKGNKPVTHIYPDVITARADENMTHGAQKPVAVYTNLLQRSVQPGGKVLDCFAGTGTILPAAHGFQCSATALEQNPEYYAMCLKRLSSLQQAETNVFEGAS